MRALTLWFALIAIMMLHRGPGVNSVAVTNPPECINNGTVLVSCNAFTGTEVLIRDFSEILPGAFSNLTQLTYFGLFNISSPTLPPNLLDSMPNLEILYLNTMKCQTLPVGFLNNQTQLHTFQLLRNYQLQYFPDDLFRHARLQSLSVYETSLTKWPVTGFGDLSQLTRLVIRNNLLKALPYNALTGHLATLGFTYTGDSWRSYDTWNQWQYPPCAEGKPMPTFQICSAWPGECTRNGSVLHGCTNMGIQPTLMLANFGLTTISPSTFSGYSLEGDLDLSGNQLTTLPTGIFENVQVSESVHLEDNDLQELPLGVMQGLQADQLILNGNHNLFVPAETVHAQLFIRTVRASPSNCTSAARGYVNWLGALVCSDCPVGHVCPEGTTEPTPCPQGTFNRHFGATSLSQCVLCGMGTFNDQEGGSSGAECTLCPAGSFGNTTGAQGLEACHECRPGSSNAIPGRPQCDACPRGTYQGVYGSTTCHECPAGTYSSVIGALSTATCATCPPSRPIALPGSTQLTDCHEDPAVLCSPGMYFHNTSAGCGSCPRGFVCEGGSLVPVTCPVGAYCEKGTAQPTWCPRGTFNSLVGAASVAQCTRCGQGTFCDVEGAISGANCALCPAGTFSNATGATDIVDCHPCPQGSASAIPGRPSCDACPRGTYQTLHGATACVECPSGTFSSAIGAQSASTCNQCPTSAPNALPGSTHLASCIPDPQVECPTGHAFNATAQVCLQCPAGVACPGGSQARQLCAPGHYCPLGTTVQVLCPRGTFNTQFGSVSASACTPCGQGTFSDMEGATTGASCALCPAGTFSNSTGAQGVDACVPCGAGTASAIPGRPSCDVCPRGTFQPQLGATTCTECPAGTYNSVLGAQHHASCVACPASHPNALPGSTHVSDCTADPQLECPAGYDLNTTSGVCVPCPAGVACAGGTATRQPCVPGEYCPLGTIAPQLCPRGTFNSAARATHLVNCTQCGQGTFNDIEGAASGADCALCPAGTFSNVTGASELAACSPCEPGTASAIPGRPACDACHRGSYQNVYGATQCVECPLDTFSATLGAHTGDTCAACPTTAPNALPGSSQLSDCIPDPKVECSPGSAFNQSQQACVACVAGQACAGGTAQPQVCVAGTFCPTGALYPVQCPMGTFNPNTASASAAACVACGMGTFSDLVGAASGANCALCPAGTFNNHTGAQSVMACLPCPTGQASAIPGRPQCDVCRRGTFQQHPGATTCTECPGGTFSSALGAISVDTCATCPPATPNALSGSSQLADCLADPPIECAPGQFFDDIISVCRVCPPGAACVGGTATMQPCATGTYATGGATVCAQCPPGTYGSHPMAVDLQSACPACPPGTTSQHAGQQHCDACPWGHYQPDAGATEVARCLACPTPGACLSGTIRPLSELATSLVSQGAPLVGGPVAPITPMAGSSFAQVHGPGGDEVDGARAEAGEVSLGTLGTTATLIMIIGAASVAALLLLGHRRLPAAAARMDVFAREHQLKAGQAVTFSPTRLGAACTVTFVLLAVLLMWSLFTSPNESYATGLIASADAVPLGPATSTITATLEVFGDAARIGCEPSDHARVASTGLGSVDGDMASVSSSSSSSSSSPTSEHGQPSLRVHAAHDSCRFEVQCQSCQLAAHTQLRFRVPWAFQLQRWTVLTASDRMTSGASAVVMAEPGGMVWGDSVANLAWLPTYLIDDTAPQLSSTLRGASAALKTQAGIGNLGAQNETADAQSKVVTVGHMLQFRTGDTGQATVDAAAVHQNDTVTLTIVLSRSDVAHQTIITSTLTFSQRLSTILSAVMSLLSFVALLFRYSEVIVARLCCVSARTTKTSSPARRRSSSTMAERVATAHISMTRLDRVEEARAPGPAHHRDSMVFQHNPLSRTAENT